MTYFCLRFNYSFYCIFMVYNYYYEAYDALVKDNDGVLPDLYESANLIISCHPSNLLSSLTVADVVALALVEVSAMAAARRDRPQPPQIMASTTPVDLDELLARAVVSSN